VEKEQELGGTCLRVGCIPSKALLHSSHIYEEARHSFAEHGIGVGEVSLDLSAMMKRKDGVVSATVKGVDFLIKKNKIERLVGSGSIVAAGLVAVQHSDGSTTEIRSRAIVLATGSEPTPLSGVEVDEKRVVTSTGALALSKIPKSMVVVGAGVIGLELGSVWRRLGSEITVVEYLDSVLPGMDGEVSATARKILEKQGIRFRLSTKVTGAKVRKSGVELTLEPRAGGDAETLSAEIVLVAIGRRPYSAGLGLEKVGVALDPRGFVVTDAHFATNVAGIYAIGDLIGGAMLAHKAEEEGVALAEILAGQAGHVNYDAVPAIVYTEPEIASLGKTEEALKESGVPYRSGKFPFRANARARVVGSVEGFVKILAHAETDAVLGVHIVGPAAGELIQECVLGMEFGAAAEDIARTSHGHPGLYEVVKEAALAVDGRALHI
jgi:dihydrolipoamide dehydrogenase